MRKKFYEVGMIEAPFSLSYSDVDRINSDIDFILDNPGDFLIIYETDGKTPRSIVNPQKQIENFFSIIKNPNLVHLVKDILGEDFYIFQLGVNLKNGIDGGVWKWHRDFPTYHNEDGIELPNMINVLIYLDNFNRDNGSFQYIPRSHITSSSSMDFSYNNTSHKLRYASNEDISNLIENNGIVYADGKKGDIRLMHTNILHASNANLHHYSRRLITLTLNSISNKAKKRSSRKNIVDDDTYAEVIHASY